jgi:hypothetical protein
LPPGSIEQQLDMCERGDLRGDEILHHHGRDRPKQDPDLRAELDLEENFRVDMAETQREGDEMSGDEHSSGLQGGEPELERQPHLSQGLPGEETLREETEGLNRRRRRAS